MRSFCRTSGFVQSVCVELLLRAAASPSSGRSRRSASPTGRPRGWRSRTPGPLWTPTSRAGPRRGGRRRLLQGVRDGHPVRRGRRRGPTVAVLFDTFLALGVGLGLGAPARGRRPGGRGLRRRPDRLCREHRTELQLGRLLDSASVVGSGLPGRSTMIFVSAPWPCRATSASEIPLPLTRCRMMLTDSSTAVGSTLVLPAAGWGRGRSPCRPRGRARASGVHCALSHWTPAATAP